MRSPNEFPVIKRPSTVLFHQFWPVLQCQVVFLSILKVGPDRWNVHGTDFRFGRFNLHLTLLDEELSSIVAILHSHYFQVYSMQMRKNQEEWLLELERELGVAVGQLRDLDQIGHDGALQVSLERHKEASAELRLGEQRILALERQLAAERARFSQERSELEKRLATALVEADAARNSEAGVLEKTNSLSEKLSLSKSAQAQLEELKKMNEELSRRVRAQTEQVRGFHDDRLRMKEEMERRAEQEQKLKEENSKLLFECARFEAEAKRIEMENDRLKTTSGEMDRQMEKVSSLEESLASALRLSETRERQIASLEDAIAKMNEEHSHVLSDQKREISRLKTTLRGMEEKFTKSDRLRIEESSTLHEQLRQQRQQTLNVTKQLADSELEAARELRRTVGRSRGLSDEESSVIVGNKVVDKVLEGKTEKKPIWEDEDGSFKVPSALDLMTNGDPKAFLNRVLSESFIEEEDNDEDAKMLTIKIPDGKKKHKVSKKQGKVKKTVAAKKKLKKTTRATKTSANPPRWMF